MKSTILKTFAYAFIATLFFTSCQKESNTLQEASSPEIIEKTEGTTTLSAIQSNNKSTAKALDITLAPTLQAAPAKARASSGARALGCGAYEVASNNGTGNSFNFYGFNGDDEFYYFDVTYNGTFVVDLFDLSADLDVFLLKKIGSQYQVIDYSANYYSKAERMISDLSKGSYAILVDAYNAGITSNYKITVKCVPPLLNEEGGNFLYEPLNFNSYQTGEKVANVDKEILRFDPNRTNDPIVAGYGSKKRMQVLPNMQPVLILDQFVQDQLGLVETKVINMRIPYGKNARLGLEKSVENGVPGTCLIDLESDGSIWFRIQGKWHRSSKLYQQGRFIEVQINHYSESGEYVIRIDNVEIASLTSDLQVEASTSGSREYIGISFQTFNLNSEYEIEEIREWVVSPAGGSSRVKKKEITIDIN